MSSWFRRAAFGGWLSARRAAEDDKFAAADGNELSATVRDLPCLVAGRIRENLQDMPGVESQAQIQRPCTQVY